MRRRGMVEYRLNSGQITKVAFFIFRLLCCVLVWAVAAGTSGFTGAEAIAANQGREVQSLIRKTSVWQRPQTEKKKVPPKIEATGRKGSQLIQKNRWFVRQPTTPPKREYTSSRRYLPQAIKLDEREIKTGRQAYKIAQPKIRIITSGELASGYAAKRLAELRKKRITKEMEKVSRNVLGLVEKGNDISDSFRPSP